MAVEISSLDELDQTLVDQAFEYAVQLVTEAEPGLDARRGVVGQLLIGLDAILGGAAIQNTQRQRQSLSLLKITENPEIADDDTVNETLSNYRITRRSASQAVGEVTIVLDRLVAVTIPAGAVLEANGQQFTSNAAYAARTVAANVLVATDRLLKQIGTDRYAFTIFVTAVNPGDAGQARKDDKFVPLTLPLGFVTAYATEDFTGAVNTESNAELIARLESGLAVRAFSGRVAIAAMIRAAPGEGHELAKEGFANILAFSFVGAGDAEMMRDQHWIFPVSGGGRVDAYVRSQALYATVSLTKTATLVDRVSGGGIWQFSIGRDEAPGFYEASRIAIEGDSDTTSGYEVVTTIRSFDDTQSNTPDIATAVEASFSPYQTATIRFLDTDTAVTESDVNTLTKSYDVALKVMPLVSDLQAYLGDRSVTQPAGDVLVKGAIPCFLSVSMSVERRRTNATISESSIAAALADFVNNTGFPGKLYTSDLVKIASELLPSGVSVRVLEMFGRILKPDGSSTRIRSTEILTVPVDYDRMVSGRTVAFFLDPNDVAVSDVNVDVPAV